MEWVPFPSPGDLPDLGIKLRSPALQADSLPPEPGPGKPSTVLIIVGRLIQSFELEPFL